ncbi:collagen, type I, alpha 1b [Oryctolagus cuniculus]|uniref:collagen, type I, alpha 1b n=1 Tax=Oryctolagus cuniculus TaxID=9986 RepID=UPI00387A77F1
MPGRCVGPSRSGRAARRPWGKRRVAGTSRGCGARRQARSSVGETRCVGAERLQDRRRPRGRRRAVQTAGPARADEAAGTPGVVGSSEAASDPGAVWVNGAVRQPEVVGPAGSVWVTRSGEDESDDRSPRVCERKGRPGSVGHESILELWLKVQAMRAASGCGQGSRVELHPMPAGEGPVERGVPGRSSWVETSRCGLTGPWVKGQARAFPRAAVLSTAGRLGAGGQRASCVCGQGQAGRVPPFVGAAGATEKRSGVAPHLLERGQAAGVPKAGGGPGPWGKGQPEGVSEAAVWERGCGGTPGLWGRGPLGQVPGALAQEATCGDTPGLWGRGQAMGVPDTVGVPRVGEEEAASVGAQGTWAGRQDEAVGSGGIPGWWGTGQPTGMPCAVEEEACCGSDLGLRGRGRAVWVETGSGGGPEPWGALRTGELSSPGGQEAGSGGAPGLWNMEQAAAVSRALGRDTGLWGGEQPEVAQAAVVSGAMGEETSSGGVAGLWEREQALGVPPAAPGLVGGEVYSGDVWERGQATGEQEASCGDGSCPCGGRRAREGSETAVGVPRHRCATAGGCAALGVPATVPAAVWAADPAWQEGSSRHGPSLWRMAQAAARPPVSGGPVEREPGSGAFLGSWGRRQAVGVPVVPEVLGLVGETGSEDVPRCWRRRQSDRVPMATEGPAAPGTPGALEAETESGGLSDLLGRRPTTGIPAMAGLAPAGGVPVAPRTPGPVQEEAGCGGYSGLWGRRENVEGRADAKGPTRVGVPTSARLLGPKGEKTGSGGISCLLGGRQAAGVPLAVGAEVLSGCVLDTLGRRETAEVPAVALGVPVASGVPGSTVGCASSEGSLGMWRRRPATEMPTAAGVPGPVVGEMASEGVSSLWGRRHSGAAPGTVRGSLPVGVLAAVGVPTAGRAPAAVWVTASTAEEAGVDVSDLIVGRTQATEGVGPSQEGAQGRAGRSRAGGVAPSCGRGAGLWSCPGPVGEESAWESVLGASGTSTAVGGPLVSRDRFRDGLQQNGGRQVGGVCGLRVRGRGLGETYVGEDRLRGPVQ